MNNYGYYKRTLSSLMMQDFLYYVGDICDVDGNPWVDAIAAQKILDKVNAEQLQKVLDDDQLRRDLSYKQNFVRKGDY